MNPLWFVKACWIVAIIGVAIAVFFSLILKDGTPLINAAFGIAIAAAYTMWVF